ncbi:TPA: LOW QUALITY PROTEIN: hypothetical protein N0F65_003551 [Lagenidium giganteum]|uniref:Uncharacterized protein n=1 Tax=Lagenidium giganteum TaxID=4803 RepID=A0AAV2Z4Y2_9STRA|nr:TPA: LOW QUALITY PROTEIN: hypothetical protein N0F65_003551 [Lagenidium giganteum]
MGLESVRPGNSARTVVEKAQAKWREARTRAFDHDIPRSIPGILSSLFSVVLLCSDVARSGLGSRTAPFDQLQPNVYTAYGPWSYPVSTTFHNDTSITVRVWTFKYDTTSIAWRSTAMALNVSSYPRCMIDYTACEGEYFNQSTLFRMTDEMVDTFARLDRPHSNHLEPRSRTLRAKVTFRDRLHDRIYPQALTRTHMTTVSAVYYPPQLVARRQGINLCRFLDHRPSFCHDIWANFATNHGTEHRGFMGTGHIAHHIRSRLQNITRDFSRHVVDMLILSQAEDARVSAGGIEHESLRYVDVSVITRVRDCDRLQQTCSTIMVDDYRYESGTYVMDGNDWYLYVAALRSIGQAYFVVRLVCLCVGCYVARRQEEEYQHESWWVSNSAHPVPHSIPVVCYAFAHLIDSPLEYEALFAKFITYLGFDDPTSRSIPRVCKLGAIQMRSLWLLGCCLQLVVWLQTCRSWSPSDGVRGLPEYAMSILPAVTLSASYRADGSTDFRVHPVHEVMVTAERDHRGRAALAFDSHGRGLCLSTLVILTLLLCTIGWLGSWLLFKIPPHRWFSVAQTTVVPYSAGSLWPTTTVSIHWSHNIYPRRPLKVRNPTMRAILNKVAPDVLREPMSLRPSPINHPQDVRLQMNVPHERTDEIHAVVALLNLFSMTDPCTLCRLFLGKGIDVCYVQHIPTRRICCLPKATVEAQHGSIPWYEMHVIGVDNTANMRWTDLLHCG